MTLHIKESGSWRTVDQPFVNVDGTNTTETMLTENPDIYLYGALLEAEPFIMNDERVPLWMQGFSQAVADLQEPLLCLY